MAFRRVMAGSFELSDEQALVLACLEAGLGETDTCESTGLNAERLAVVVRDLKELHAFDTSSEPGAVSREAASNDAEVLPSGIEPWTGEAMPEGSASSHDLHAPASEDDPGSNSSLPPRRSKPPPVDEVNFRRVYETRFRDLEVGQRKDVALHVSGPELFALCFDPAPEVIAALLDNLHFGLDHARVVALHHKTPAGLEILARRAQLLRDHHVQRRLLQNMQTPENVLDRVLRLKRLLDVYRLSIDRDLPERNRMKVRARLRPCFANAEPEERATLIIKTEGRCLIGLSGCTFDARTTQILCHQSFLSPLFIQNLARFSATPPVLIQKLLRSPTVQRQPQLRSLLLRHSNSGGEGRGRGA
ncbi:MAG: hypothetical protein ABI895_32470 [Deltaproteobacteria bacterium]